MSGYPSSFVDAVSVSAAQTITGDKTFTGDVTITGRFIATGLADFAEVRAATTANITLSGAQTIDGVAVVAGDRVLVKNQSTASQNGLYDAAAGAWSRSVDLPTGASAAGLVVIVQEGTVSADVQYICTNDAGSDVVGTNNLVFVSGAVVDSLLVHKAGAENISGVKTFQAGIPISTGQTLTLGPNTLAGAVTDKLNPVHLAIASQAIGDLLYADGATTMTRLASVAAGSYLRSGGVGTAPVWSTVTLPNTATTGDLMYASAANTYANLAGVALGQVLCSGGVGTAPAWSGSPRLAALADANGVTILTLTATASAVRVLTYTPGATGTNAALIASGENGAGLDLRADPNGTPGSLRMRNPGNTATILGIQPSGAGTPGITAYSDTQTGVGPTLSRPSGIVRVPNGSTSVTVTSTLCETTSLIWAQIRNTTSNAVSVLRVVPGAGSFNIVLSGDPGASNADIAFLLVNPSA